MTRLIRSADALVNEWSCDLGPNSRCVRGWFHGNVYLGAVPQWSEPLTEAFERDSEMLKHLVKFQVRAAQLRDERGATAVEYGLLVALIAAVIVAVVVILGTQIKAAFNTVSTAI
jgi:pilus assembly protein Flp/PilA